MLKQIRKYSKHIAATLIVTFVTEFVAPNVSYALTSGPAQPEYTSFEPVSTTNMVDPLSGSFTYNLPVIDIPGPNGAGYAASLSYHSGVKPDEEASWVGFGWTLNPGAIQRSQRGFADDHKGADVKYYNKARTNWTMTGTLSGTPEIYSFDPSLNLSGSIRYNNYMGFGSAKSIGLSYSGASITASFDGNGDRSFSAQVNIGRLLKGDDEARLRRRRLKTMSKWLKNEGTIDEQGSQKRLMKIYREKGSGSSKSVLNSFGSSYSASPSSSNSKNTMGLHYKGGSVTFGQSFQVDPTLAHWGIEWSYSGRFSYQTNEKTENGSGYGMMYQRDALTYDAGIASINSTNLMDYYMEKESSYNARDKMLPVPYKNSDVFSVTGEGIGGNFKLQQRNVGHFYPTQKKSTTPIVHVNLDHAAGLNVEPLGPDVGGGFATFELNKWPGGQDGNTPNYQFQNNNSFFRFSGDLGGNVIFGDSEKEYQARLKNQQKSKAYIDGNDLPQVCNNGDKPGQSSYIGYHTIGEMLESIDRVGSGSVYYKSFNKRSDIRSHFLSGTESTFMQNTIGELSIVNEDGNQYVYGLPVYAANKKELAYEIDPTSEPIDDSEFLIYRKTDDDPQVDIDGKDISTIRGQHELSPTATQYLLTEITGPNYVDRTFDGPSNDDFGAWTKFNYRAPADSHYTASVAKDDATKWAGWFHYRFPFTGFTYNKGDISNPNDDMANFSSGDKEVYYLKSIETKTHIAYFVTNYSDYENIPHATEGTIDLTGSETVRHDSHEADSDDIADETSTAKGEVSKERLEKIILYAKDDAGNLVGKPIKTVNLEYYASSDELCQGIPNTSASQGNGGKLTLKKVWFEYEGISNSKIRPYTFEYAYKASFPSALTTKYSFLTDFDYGLSAAQQNPDYDKYGIDAWGNYRLDGLNRFKKMRPWVQQHGVDDLDSNPDQDYDPAAWNLKTIKLPSGGQILVQYEQADYTSVQDQTPLGMVPLKKSDGTDDAMSELTASSADKYYLNLDEIDIKRDVSGIHIDDLNVFKDSINSYLDDHKVYFKFLYKLKSGVSSNDPSLTNCRSGYITGYADAEAFTENTTDYDGKVYLKFDAGSYNLPRQVCLDFVKKNKQGLNLSNECFPAHSTEKPPGTGVKNLVKALGNMFATIVPFDEATYCTKLSVKDSYFRLPTPKAKKGGGIRVKRLLMYDDGLETGDEVIYGTEYLYEQIDGTSSGVALNEPAGMREECALVKHMDKRASQWIGAKILSGLDKEQFEEPYGESLLPGASVNYDRVVIKNIHDGKTTTGYTVNEYYSVRNPDHRSYHRYHTPVSRKGFPIPIFAGLVNFSQDNRWVSQGYTFIVSNIHGRLKRTATYPEAYDSTNPNPEGFETSEQIFEYTGIGEKVKVMKNDGTSTDEYIGREDEVAIEMRRATNINRDFDVQLDPSFTAFPPSIQFSALPYFSYSETEINRHVINKVIRYSPILKKTITKQDGLISVTENSVFDVNTGNPIVTTSYDSYDGLSIDGSAHKGQYVNYTIPAAKIYQTMGQKSVADRFVLNGSFTLYSDVLGEKTAWLNKKGDDCYAKNAFLSLQDADNPRIDYIPTDGEGNALNTTSRQALIDAFDAGQLNLGDLIELSNGSDKALFYVNEFDDFHYERIYLQPLSIAANDLINDNAQATFTRLEVIKPGRTNQLKVPTATVVTYGKDAIKPYLVLSDGRVSLSTSFQQVVSASVTTFTDDWYSQAIASKYNVQYDCSGANTFETGARGKWRPKATFAYEDDIEHGVDVSGGERTFKSGYFKNSFSEFVFKENESSLYYSEPNPSFLEQTSVGEYLNYPIQVSSSKWVQLNQVNVYSPHGEPLEEVNKIGVKSTAKFSYNEKLPVLVAANAGYEMVEFTSFENDSRSNVTSSISHAGGKSALMNPGEVISLDSLEAQPDLDGIANNEKVLVKMWLHSTQDVYDNLNSNLKVSFKRDGETTITLTDFSQVARSGKWILVEGTATGFKTSDVYYDNTHKVGRGPGTNYSVEIENLGTRDLYIDDVRLQPLESQMTTYVYDPITLRLLTTFDDQHFGMYYQYNAEGKLVRKMIETERGLKTVTESQYNTPSQAR